jgi:hypothetical protein
LFVLIINMQCKFFVSVACGVDCSMSWLCIPYYFVVGNELHGFGWVLQEAHNNGNGVASHSAWRNYDDFNEFFWCSSCFHDSLTRCW